MARLLLPIDIESRSKLGEPVGVEEYASVDAELGELAADLLAEKMDEFIENDDIDERAELKTISVGLSQARTPKQSDKNRLTINERLELFMPVCRAIQHAHQKGIIHRDLKPSNVLLCLYDGKPVPKVIDFGLAKALQHTTQLTDQTMFTEFGEVVGTLQYSSPEQAEMNQLDIDTRTDIYSLGVMM